jgi:uncharacterized protein involved in response to NO
MFLDINHVAMLCLLINLMTVAGIWHSGENLEQSAEKNIVMQ